MPRPRADQSAPRPKLRDSEVLEVAVRTFYEYGYAAASVQRIADETGLMKGSLYYYMSSKEDLLYRVLKDVHDELGLILDRSREDTSGTPLERLARYVRDQVGYAAGHRHQIAIYYREVDHLDPEHHREIVARRREHEAFVRQLVKQAQADGSTPSQEDPKVLADLVFGSFIWTYQWYDPKGRLGAEKLADACARFAVRALSSPPE